MPIMASITTTQWSITSHRSLANIYKDRATMGIIRFFAQTCPAETRMLKGEKRKAATAWAWELHAKIGKKARKRIKVKWETQHSYASLFDIQQWSTRMLTLPFPPILPFTFSHLRPQKPCCGEWRVHISTCSGGYMQHSLCSDIRSDYNADNKPCNRFRPRLSAASLSLAFLLLCFACTKSKSQNGTTPQWTMCHNSARSGHCSLGNCFWTSFI